MKHSMSFNMDFEMYDFIERVAEDVGVSKSEIIRRMIRMYMEERI